jgi:hypothetical protein
MASAIHLYTSQHPLSCVMGEQKVDMWTEEEEQTHVCLKIYIYIYIYIYMWTKRGVIAILGKIMKTGTCTQDPAL